jgi:hypothetical protein
MVGEDRPRRFFGLLCAHKWVPVGEAIGSRGTVKSVLQCEHCGELKMWP